MEQGRVADLSDLASAIDSHPESVRELIALCQPCLSLNRRIDEYTTAEWIDQISDDKTGAVADQVENQNSLDELQSLLNKQLTKRQADIVRRYFGMAPYDPQGMSLASIARELSLSKERVRQLLHQALYCLKRPENARRLRSLFYD
jgi:RNA polymerase sigma factor (sigma-70 family)